MLIERQKPQLLAAVFAISVLASGCDSARPRLEATRTSVFTPGRSNELCPQSIEALRPPTLSRESVKTYPGVVVINRAGAAMDLSIRPSVLTGINSEDSLGLNFTPDTVNIVYFDQNSFKMAGTTRLVADFFEQYMPPLLLRYCQEQHKSSGRVRFSAISVADELQEIIKKNPRNYSSSDLFWKNALEVQLAMAYVARTKDNVTDINKVQIETPNLSPQERATIVRFGLPFSITRLNSNYVYLFQQLQDATISV